MDLVDTIDGYGKSPSKVAHVYRGSSLTYENLVGASDALACWLIDEFGDDKNLMKAILRMTCFFLREDGFSDKTERLQN